LAARHDSLSATQAHDHRAAFKAGDGAGNDGADAILEFFVNAAALVLADELDHHLLNRLRADAAHDRKRQSLTLSADGTIARRPIDRHAKFAGVFRIKLFAQTGGDGLLD